MKINAARQALPSPSAPVPTAGSAAAPIAAGATSGYAPDQMAWSVGLTPSPVAAEPLRQSLVATFQAGVERDLAGRNQADKLTTQLAGLSDGQLQSLQGLVGRAASHAEQVFILKAYTAGETWNNLVAYADEMRGRPEAEVISRSTMRDDADVVQQWQDSCGPTLLQTLAGEADPRYAWELNKTSDVASLAPTGAAMALADQQKAWLEAYGGIAVERGTTGGQGIALGQMLNDKMGPLVGATYQTVEATDAAASLGAIADKVASGLDVPIRISWNRPGDGQDTGHFVVAMATREGTTGRELQIHDPWTGRTAWVSEAGIANDSFSPIFNTYARMSHYYPAEPQSA